MFHTDTEHVICECCGEEFEMNVLTITSASYFEPDETECDTTCPECGHIN
jgi:hypothetical protein